MTTPGMHTLVTNSQSNFWVIYARLHTKQTSKWEGKYPLPKSPNSYLGYLVRLHTYRLYWPVPIEGFKTLGEVVARSCV